MNKDPDSKITLLLPTKNEAGGVRQVIEGVHPFVDEILVIDGHSTDGTADIAREAGAWVVHDNGKGKGAALRLGIAEASHEILVCMDADGSHDPNDIPKLVQPILDGEADLVVGSRIRGGSDELHGDFSNFVRAIGSGIITISVNYRWNVRITDTLNGFRAIKTSVARDLNLKANDFDIEQHMVCCCLKKGYTVIDIPSHEGVRLWGVSKLPTYKKAYLFFGRLFLDLI